MDSGGRFGGAWALSASKRMAAVECSRRASGTTGIKAATGLSELAEREVDQLSGWAAATWVAMALAQQTPWLLLDEPTTYLDIAHQIELLELFTQLNREHGRTFSRSAA